MAKYLIALLASALAAAGCSGTSNSSDGGAVGIGADSPAGVVIGPLDSHCTAPDGGLIVQSIGTCNVTDPTLVPASTAGCGITFNNTSGADGGAAPSDYGATMYGSAGDDDDCKYYVAWTANPIQENADTYFTVTALRLEDMQPVHCADIRADTELSISHGAPPPPNPAPEIAPGVYRVGPIRFDAKGIWTVRFHLFEECNDGPEDSPHGHAAFYVNVP